MGAAAAQVAREFAADGGAANTVKSFNEATKIALENAKRAQSAGGGVAGVVSGVFSAVAYMQVKELGAAGEPDWRIVFYFSLGGVLLGLGWVAVEGMHALTWHGTALMLGIGLAALIAQTALTRAFSLGNTLVTANLQYSGVIFATLISMLVWDDWPALAGWIGMLLIVASGMTALRRPSAPA